MKPVNLRQVLTAYARAFDASARLNNEMLNLPRSDQIVNPNADEYELEEELDEAFFYLRKSMAAAEAFFEKAEVAANKYYALR